MQKYFPGGCPNLREEKLSLSNMFSRKKWCSVNNEALDSKFVYNVCYHNYKKNNELYSTCLECKTFKHYGIVNKNHTA